MKYICLLMMILSTSCSNQNVRNQSKRVLFVVTSHENLGSTGKKTGAYFSEIAHPYAVLTKAGYEIDFVSPKGGNTPLDGLKKLDMISKRLLKNKKFINKLRTTKLPKEIKSKLYDAVYFAGGHGTMFDLPDNKTLQKITSEIYEGGGVVSGVCHGPAGLVNVRLSDGSYLISGKKMSAFTNEEEEAVKLTKVMPFLLESKIKSRGAYYEKTKNFEEKVVSDQRLITGQNPMSAKKVAEELLLSLEKRSL